MVTTLILKTEEKCNDLVIKPHNMSAVEDELLQRVTGM